MRLIRLISVAAFASSGDERFLCEIEADIGAGHEVMNYVLAPNDNQGLAPLVRRAVDEWRAAKLTIGDAA